MSLNENSTLLSMLSIVIRLSKTVLFKWILRKAALCFQYSKAFRLPHYFRTRAPLTEIEMIAAMAADAVRQQKRLNQVEVRIETVTEAVENIKRGNMRAGYVGYRQVVAKSGMTDAKCRNLVNAYRIPTDTHEFMTPDGLLSRRAIVELEPFMEAFHQMMSEAEPRGTRWYHPKMGLFQAIGWEGKA